MNRRLYVSGLPYATTEDELRALFGQHGQVESCRIITDRATGKSRGFGFVEMASEDEAATVMDALDQRELGGRTIGVKGARPQENRGGGGGGRDRGGYDGGREGRRRDRW